MTNKRFFLAVVCLGLAMSTGGFAQVIITNQPNADAFVTSSDPTHNFGKAGALSVSGLVASNALGVQEGQLDSFMRFDFSNLTNTFNASLGTNNWIISSVRLTVTEQGASMNTIFNRGVGTFEIRWIASDSWIEGSGMPNALTTDGITWNDVDTNLNSAVDLSLGNFVNTGANGVLHFFLSTPSAFLNDLESGGLVSLFFVAPTNSTVGFTFNSRDFTTASARPFIEITAVAIPEPATVALVALPLLAWLGFGRRKRMTSCASAVHTDLP